MVDRLGTVIGKINEVSAEIKTADIPPFGWDKVLDAATKELAGVVGKIVLELEKRGIPVPYEFAQMEADVRRDDFTGMSPAQQRQQYETNLNIFDKIKRKVRHEVHVAEKGVAKTAKTAAKGVVKTAKTVGKSTEGIAKETEGTASLAGNNVAKDVSSIPGDIAKGGSSVVSKVDGGDIKNEVTKLVNQAIGPLKTEINNTLAEAKKYSTETEVYLAEARREFPGLIQHEASEIKKLALEAVEDLAEDAADVVFKKSVALIKAFPPLSVTMKLGVVKMVIPDVRKKITTLVYWSQHFPKTADETVKFITDIAPSKFEIDLGENVPGTTLGFSEDETVTKEELLKLIHTIEN